MSRTAIIFILCISPAFADTPHRMLLPLVSPTSGPSVSDKFNSDEGQRRLGEIVKLADRYPIPLITVLRRYDFATELQLTSRQSDRLNELKSIAVGHMLSLIHI